MQQALPPSTEPRSFDFAMRWNQNVPQIVPKPRQISDGGEHSKPEANNGASYEPKDS
jgi:hypothetical protein